jgi:hypothetical protein
VRRKIAKKDRVRLTRSGAKKIKKGLEFHWNTQNKENLPSMKSVMWS